MEKVTMEFEVGCVRGECGPHKYRMDFRSLIDLVENASRPQPNVWWFNARSGERVHTHAEEHYLDLYHRQNIYGVHIDPEWGENTRKSAMFKAGWVRVRYRPENRELNVEGRTASQVRRAAKDALTDKNVASAMLEFNERWARLSSDEFETFIAKGTLPLNAQRRDRHDPQGPLR